MDVDRTRTRGARGAGPGWLESGDGATHAQKDDLKPWRRLMWCIGTLSEEYRSRMYNLLALYASLMCPEEPVICVDEKSPQLIGHSRAPLPMTAHAPAKEDYEYTRNGTTNLFVAVEPKAGQRIMSVTDHRAPPPSCFARCSSTTRELVEHGRDRDRHPQSPMPEPARSLPADLAQRSRCVATRSQRTSTNHRVQVHSTGR